MSEFAEYATEAHRTGSATAIGNADLARERVCLELRRLRALEDVLPPEFEAQFRSVSNQAMILLTENLRDGWPIPGDVSEPSHGAEARPCGSDQSLDGSLTDPSPPGVDHWAIVPSGGGGGATGQPSIDVRLKDLKLNFTLFDSRPPVSSPTQEDNLYPRIIELPTSDDIPRSRPKMVTFDHDKVGHSPAVNQLPPETDSDGNLDMTDNRYAEMLCEAERVKAQMD